MKIFDVFKKKDIEPVEEIDDALVSYEDDEPEEGYDEDVLQERDW